MKRLKKRADFLKAAQGRRWATQNFTLQAKQRAAETHESEARLGFTVTKRVGASVERNRIRRRLKGAIAASLSTLRSNDMIKAGFDYVIVARRPAINAEFGILISDLNSAFMGVHRERSSAKAAPKI